LRNNKGDTPNIDDVLLKKMLRDHPIFFSKTKKSIPIWEAFH